MDDESARKANREKLAVEINNIFFPGNEERRKRLGQMLEDEDKRIMDVDESIEYVR